MAKAPKAAPKKTSKQDAVVIKGAVAPTTSLLSPAGRAALKALGAVAKVGRR